MYKLQDNLNIHLVLLQNQHYNMFNACYYVLLLLFLIYCETVACYYQSDKLKITTPSGQIQGTTLKSRLGKDIYAFKAIRYAKAPINGLRFKPPVAIKKWDDDIYDGTKNGTLCPQPLPEGFPLPISEDCLFLNVYTTKLPEKGHNPSRPVIIHLHPGGFYSSNGHPTLAGPQYFLDQDIVLVTLNYRLASLGFLSLGTADSPGNNGLKDQVVALKWVQRNIAAFGGNPNSVTLYGYSAGSWSITLHMVSNMSRGLFHKAIISSGSAVGQWPLPRDQLKLAKKQAKLIGCDDSGTKQIFECLKRAKVDDLVKSFYGFAEFGQNPVLIWSPVIERDFKQERFLEEDPVKLFQDGDFEKVPVILGVTEFEFSNLVYPIVDNDSLLHQLDQEWNKYAPIVYIYAPNSTVSQTIRKYYIGDGHLTKSSVDALARIAADSIDGFPVIRTADLIAAKSHCPVYYYEFTYKGRFSNFYVPGSNNTVLGPVHHDDLMYTFYISLQFPFFEDDYPESKMVAKLTKLYANFARFNNPTPKYDGIFDNTKWSTYDLQNQRYLDLGEKLVMKEKLFWERYLVWKKLYPVA